MDWSVLTPKEISAFITLLVMVSSIKKKSNLHNTGVGFLLVHVSLSCEGILLPNVNTSYSVPKLRYRPLPL